MMRSMLKSSTYLPVFVARANPEDTGWIPLPKPVLALVDPGPYVERPLAPAEFVRLCVHAALVRSPGGRA